MPRIIGIDYGRKRVGLAATDPLKIIASPLTTVDTPKAIKFLKEYTATEEVELFVIGLPQNLQDEDTDSTSYVRNFIKELKKAFANIPVYEEDERYTSKMASQIMVAGGMKKKDRQKKGNLDKVSASLILQSYLDSHPS